MVIVESYFGVDFPTPVIIYWMCSSPSSHNILNNSRIRFRINYLILETEEKLRGQVGRRWGRIEGRKRIRRRHDEDNKNLGEVKKWFQRIVWPTDLLDGECWVVATLLETCPESVAEPLPSDERPSNLIESVGIEQLMVGDAPAGVVVGECPFVDGA